MKQLSLTFCLAFFVFTFILANSPALIVNDCINANGGTAVAMLTIPYDSIVGWSANGDLRVSAQKNSPVATVTSTGYGKGCVSVAFYATDSANCVSGASADIFKYFDLPDSIQIQGPLCVSPGDVVVYSIAPLVTRNLNARIGVDSYYWNVDSLVNMPNSFVEEVNYTSGDSSAVTFRVKDWDETIGPNEITVSIGRCNQTNALNTRRLTITKQAPKPNLGANYMCIPYGTDTFTLTVQNALPNVAYTWDKPIDWEFVSFNADSTSVAIRPNKSTPGIITVYAAYRSNQGMECAISQTAINVYRRWGNDTYISGTGCAEVGKSSYRFQVSGEIPTNTPVSWELPQTWVMNSGEPASPIIKASPTTASPLVDTIRVHELTECGATDLKYASLPVSVKPASVQLSGEQCVEVGQTYTYRINRKPGTLGPNAQTFAWYINGELQEGLLSDTANIQISSSTRYILVRPLGYNGCDGNMSDTLKIMVNPSNPTGISRIDNGQCITAGMQDTIMLQVDGSVASQDYEWDLSKTHNWQIIEYLTANHSQVSVRTSGIAGNDTIEAYTAGEGICQDTRRVSINYYVPGTPFTISASSGRARYYDFEVSPYDLTTLPEFANETSLYYIWDVNGLVEDSDFDAMDFTVYRNQVSTTDVVRLTVVTSTGCKYATSIVIGEALNINNLNPLFSPKKSKENQDVAAGELNIFPNPANTELNIEFPVYSQNSQIRVYNANGQLVINDVINGKRAVLPIVNLPDGIYSLILTQNSIANIVKFIVQH
ncbi:MAG: T9SS type A sorting domain-containing protein [Paludibacteraceae bacterium]|nr:T9SS type A sorting domain-containing protein [Paludibacteraceae bacterium]